MSPDTCKQPFTKAGTPYTYTRRKDDGEMNSGFFKEASASVHSKWKKKNLWAEITGWKISTQDKKERSKGKMLFKTVLVALRRQ